MSDWNTVNGVCCKPWLVLPAVYSDALSYGDQIAQFCSALNKVIQNNNNLPSYVQQMIQEYISGGVIGDIIQNVIAEFVLNVKFPPNNIKPAVGDGSADDTEAIQGCIDYASANGGVVYFPYGSYLTQPINMKDGVSLFGFDRYSTKIVLKGGATKPLISGTVANLSIANLTLDGNMDIQVNNIDLVNITGSEIQLVDSILTDGYTLFNIEKTGNIYINNVDFKYAVESMIKIRGTIGIINADNVTFGALSAIKGIAGIISSSNNDVFNGIVSDNTLPLFAKLDGNNNVLKGKVNSVNLISDNGQNNVYDFYGRAKNEYYSGDVSEAIQGNSAESVEGNKNTFVTGTTSNTYKDDVISTFNKNSTESVDGNKSTIITGTTSNTYKDDVISTFNKNSTETLSEKKIINAQDIVLNPENPLTYKKPITGTYTNYIPMKDPDGNVYNVMVSSAELDTRLNGLEFATANDLISADVKDGDYAHTSGYSSQNDGGECYYVITNVKSDFSLVLNNGLFATPIYGDCLNIKALGADYTGTTDCYELIKKAITLALSLKLPVYIPSGTYLISKTLIIDTEIGTRIFGDGINSILKYSGTDFAIRVERSGDNPWTYKHAFESFEITFTQNANGGIRTKNLNESTIEDVTIWGMPHTPEYGFYNDTPQIVRFNKCTVSWCKYGFYFHGSDDTDVKLSNIYKSTYGITVEYCVGLRFIDNWVEGFVEGVRISNSVDCLCRGLTIKNNSFWQSQEHENARGFAINSVSDVNRLSVYALVENNMFYHGHPTSYSLELFCNAEPGNSIVNFINNTIIGVSQAMYNNNPNNTFVYLDNNVFTENLNDGPKYGESLPTNKTALYKFYNEYTVKTDLAVVHVPAYLYTDNTNLLIKYSGTCPESTAIYFDGTFICTLAGTKHFGEIIISNNDGTPKICVNDISENGLFHFISETINVAENTDHDFKIGSAGFKCDSFDCFMY